ncbi:P-loop containing nucleoside triphosphate hydrolase protein [Rhypophila decipiens]|uniref:P-loop containing nucleoside triphosphate hydrolase protein n=1 Tax=Rhypophila decipiens TaxID=261697 RepID=A0AAN6Y6W7_9PEZI|nr:P-loop containing nucleoside triphosphate hydrolase protein [Rhypophila decipiens]
MNSHPRIPMRMAGGRPIPGSVRSRSSSAFGRRIGSPTPEPALVPTFGHTVEGEHPFTFRDGEVASPQGLPRSDHVAPGIADAPPAGPSAPRAVREQLYGALTMSQRGSVAFEPTDRLNNWLSGLDFTSNAATDGGSETSGAVQMICPNEDTKDDKNAEKVTLGMKRRTVQDLTEEPERATKRSRLAAGIKRRFSRAAESGYPSGTAAHVHQEAEDPFREINSRLSFFSLGRERAPERTINIALLGDCNCGKTTMLNYFFTKKFEEVQPTAIASRRDLTMLDRGELVKVRFWDLPGTIGRPHLMVDNFQAAILCFNIGDAQSLERLTNYWSPILTSSLAVEGHPVFLLGLKKDQRPSYHQLRLSFVEGQNYVSRRDGQKAIHKVNAVGYAECTAKEYNNKIPCILHTAIDMTLKHVRENEERMRRNKRQEKEKEMIRGTKVAFRKTGKKIKKIIDCGKRKMGGGGGGRGDNDENDRMEI